MNDSYMTTVNVILGLAGQQQIPDVATFANNNALTKPQYQTKLYVDKANRKLIRRMNTRWMRRRFYITTNPNSNLYALDASVDPESLIYHSWFNVTPLNNFGMPSGAIISALATSGPSYVANTMAVNINNNATLTGLGINATSTGPNLVITYSTPNTLSVAFSSTGSGGETASGTGGSSQGNQTIIFGGTGYTGADTLSLNISISVAQPGNPRPLQNWKYDEFRAFFPSDDLIPSSSPWRWIIVPINAPTNDATGNIMFYPAPDAVYTIEYQAKLNAQPLVNANDETVWPAEYIDALWDMGELMLECSLGEGREVDINTFAQQAVDEVKSWSVGADEERQAVRPGFRIGGPKRYGAYQRFPYWYPSY